MSAVANSGEDKSAAPVWKHGPQGELGIGPISWPRFRQLMMVMWLPTLVLFFVIGFNIATFLISCGSVFLAARLARFEGTPELVEALTVHWGTLFAAASVGLLVLRYLANDVGSGWTSATYGLGTTAYLIATVVHFDGKRLFAWEPPGTKSAATEISITELKAMREEIEWGRVSLASLPVFDNKKPELVQAWQTRNTQFIAHLLQEGILLTQDSWKRANAMFNRAQSHTDRARKKLQGLLVQVERRLRPFNLDYAAIQIERSKLSQVEMSAAIPKTLTVKMIQNRTFAFFHAGGRAIAQGATGQLHPLAALAMVGVALVANKLYESRTLRRLKDTEGQLMVNSKAVRGDCATLETIFATRILPQFDGIIDVATRLEGGLADLRQDAIDASNQDQRDKALQLAFALVEGKKLVATTGGN